MFFTDITKDVVSHKCQRGSQPKSPIQSLHLDLAFLVLRLVNCKDNVSVHSILSGQW